MAPKKNKQKSLSDMETQIKCVKNSQTIEYEWDKKKVYIYVHTFFCFLSYTRQKTRKQ